jgi:hypothetical protein
MKDDEMHMRAVNIREVVRALSNGNMNDLINWAFCSTYMYALSQCMLMAQNLHRNSLNFKKWRACVGILNWC